MKLSRPYLLGFLLGLFTFLTELILLRQMSIFFGSGIKATGLIMFLFILGMGLGDLLAIKNYKHSHRLIACCSVSLMILAILPQIIYQLPGQKTLITYLFSLLVALPGIISGYLYAVIIRECKRDSIIIFILANTLGSLLGCWLSFVLLKTIGVKETLIILAFALILFIIKRKILFFSIIIINLILFGWLLSRKQFVNPAVYRQILQEAEAITFPPELINDFIDQKTIFKKPSPFGDVVLDNTYHLYVHNEGLCWKGSTDEREMSKVVNSLYPNAKEVLIVGLGCGITLDEYLKQNINQSAKITVVEINPVIVEAQKLFFDQNNPVDNPRVQLVIDDGYRFLSDSNQKFEVIIVDASNPVSIESSQIYTQEFVKLLYSHLTDPGKIAWWNFSTRDDYSRVFYSTVRSVFPYLTTKKMVYSSVSYISKIPFFLPLTEEEASAMNRYESLPFIINSLNRPIIK